MLLFDELLAALLVVLNYSLTPPRAFGLRLWNEHPPSPGQLSSEAIQVLQHYWKMKWQSSCRLWILTTLSCHCIITSGSDFWRVLPHTFPHFPSTGMFSLHERAWSCIPGLVKTPGAAAWSNVYHGGLGISRILGTGISVFYLVQKPFYYRCFRYLLIKFCDLGHPKRAQLS